MVRVCAITLAVAAVTVASMADDRADDGATPPPESPSLFIQPLF